MIEKTASVGVAVTAGDDGTSADEEDKSGLVVESKAGVMLTATRNNSRCTFTTDIFISRHCNQRSCKNIPTRPHPENEYGV